MACNTSLTAISKDCLANSKGLLNLYLLPREFFTGYTLSAGSVSAINLSGSAKFVEFAFPKKGANYTEEPEFDALSKSIEYVQTITATIPRREKAKRQAFELLTAGQRDLVAIIKDYNSLYWCAGLVNSVNVSGLGGGSESATYSLTLTGLEPIAMPEVDSSLIAGIIA